MELGRRGRALVQVAPGIQRPVAGDLPERRPVMATGDPSAPLRLERDVAGVASLRHTRPACDRPPLAFALRLLAAREPPVRGRACARVPARIDLYLVALPVVVVEAGVAGLAGGDPRRGLRDDARRIERL